MRDQTIHKDEDDDDYISDSVRDYCSKQDVKVVRIHVVYNIYNDYIVRCKLFVMSYIQRREWCQDTLLPTDRQLDLAGKDD